MTLKECYAILQLTQDASLDDIKRAYRKRAFELHPDLHPDLPTANQNFQLLNESYVILTKLLDAEAQFKESKTQSKTGKSSTKKQTTQDSTDKQKTSTCKRDAARSKEKEPEKSQTTQQQRTDRHTNTTTHQACPDQSVYTEQHEVVQDILADPFARRVFEDIYSEIRKKTHSDATNPNQQAHNNQQASNNQQANHNQQPHTKQEANTKQQPSRNQQANNSQQPYAKQQVNTNPQESSNKQASTSQQPQTSQAKTEPLESATATQPAFQWPFSLTWKPKHRRQDATKGLQKTVKDWLLQQIDEEQTFVIPAKRLFSGARIRLQIRQAFSDSPTTIVVTLPANFSPDTPIRLKGMGKKIGKWQGDLYLTLKPQSQGNTD